MIASPANLKMSPPDRLIADTSNSMYRLIAKAVSSAPSWPMFNINEGNTYFGQCFSQVSEPRDVCEHYH
jgi:hypothetical protein